MRSRTASRPLVALLLPLALVVAAAAHARAQDPGTSAAPDTAPRPDAPHAPDAGEGMPEVVDGKVTLNGVTFEVGPCTSKLGRWAQIDVPEGMLLTDGNGARRVLVLSQNLTSGNEVGMLMAADGSWQVFFQFDEVGYVKDDDKDDIDADALLDQYREGIAAGNEEREKKGWPPLELVGWHKAPFYDERTHNLTWSLLLKGQDSQTVNWSTRLLGRRGKMDVDLVISPEDVDAALPTFQKVLDGFRYVDGESYAEFRDGDRVAEYGLAALIAGGAGAVAYKTGILAKFWKVIVAGVVAVFVAIKRFLGFGKKDGESSTSS